MARRSFRAAPAVLLGATLLLPAATLAARTTTKPSSGEVAAKRSDLGELRDRIEQMKREVAAGESSRAEAADQLRDSEQAISDLQRELRELADQRQELQARLDEISGQARTLEGELGGQQDRLQRLLARQYASGRRDTLQLVLSGQDPNQIARNLHYLNIVARARAGLLKEVEGLLGRQRELAAETRKQALALAEVEASQRQRHAAVARERDTRKQLLSRLAARIAGQQKEIGALQRNEQRLARLVERLAKLAAATPGPRPARKSPPPGPERRNGDSSVDENEAPPAGLTGAFAKMRGRLRLPVAGPIVGRFGATREGGGTWKGIFIRAAAGGDVRAVAGGRVVFAEWMRGFGNLLIVDHGDDYLSIYGYNEALLRKLGDIVAGGEAVASIGNSGGHPESGLYFEIRHQGQALDPLKWTGTR